MPSAVDARLVKQPGDNPQSVPVPRQLLPGVQSRADDMATFLVLGKAHSVAARQLDPQRKLDDGRSFGFNAGVPVNRLRRTSTN